MTKTSAGKRARVAVRRVTAAMKRAGRRARKTIAQIEDDIATVLALRQLQRQHARKPTRTRR
jgi:hypothetical protein